MTFWTKASKFIGTIFGVSKFDAGKTFDTIAKGIDNVAWTTQEGEEARKKVFEAQIEHAKSTASESGARSKTRRYIAIAVTAVFLGLKLIAIILYNASPLYSKFISDEASSLAPYFGGIMTFYFAYYAFKQVREGKK